MASGSRKRTLDAFFTPAAKKRSPSRPSQQAKDDGSPSPTDEEPATFSTHFTYPFPIQNYPKSLHDAITWLPNRSALPMPRYINNQPDLDLLYYDPYIPRSLSQDIFRFLRASLPFYRVSYTIQRGPTPTNIVTPRFTTVFGLDSTSRFDEDGRAVDRETRTKIRREPEYTTIPPRPLPRSLEVLRQIVEKTTGERFNFCLVNYYASGADSVAYHSDDERFLGTLPVIASLSLGAKRDFMLKHKPDPKSGKQPPGTEVLKMPLGSGDLILMRGRTQSHWLHAIPKRAGAAKDDGGRINITFRKALVKGGTANYYNYNTGTGSVYRWDEERREMRVWDDREKEEVKYHRGPIGVKFEDVVKREEVKLENGEDEVEDKAEVDEAEVDEAEVKVDDESVSQTNMGEEAGDMAEDDDEAWEEKVRRQIEGEEG